MPAEVRTLQLHGERRIFYRVTDAVEAERRMGKSIRQALAETSVSDLILLVWAGLRHGDAKLTPDQVMRWMDDLKQGPTAAFSLWNSVAEALVASGILPPPPPAGEVPDVDPLASGSPGNMGETLPHG
jgi:hypothetical protein